MKWILSALVTVGAILGLDALLGSGSSSSSSKDDEEDSFMDGFRDAICGIGRQHYSGSYSVGYNLGSDDDDE